MIALSFSARKSSFLCLRVISLKLFRNIEFFEINLFMPPLLGVTLISRGNSKNVYQAEIVYQGPVC